MTGSIEIIAPFWGQFYRECFQHLCLASLLAESNLPAWPYLSSTTFVIYTPPEDFEAIQTSPQMQMLAELMPIEHRPLIFPQNTTNDYYKYGLLAKVHRDAISTAHAKGTSLILPVADVILANGSLQFLATCIEQEMELALSLALLTNTDDIGLLYNRYRQSHQLSIPPHEAVSFGIQHMSSLARVRCDETPLFSIWPNHLNTVQADNMLSRAFTLHPWYIRNPIPFPPTHKLHFDAIDADYLQGYWQQRDKIQIASDNQMICLSLVPTMPLEKCGRVASTEERLQQVKQHALSQCAPIQHWFFSHSLLYKGHTEPHEVNTTHSLSEQLLSEVALLFETEAWALDKDYDKVIAYYQSNGFTDDFTFQLLGYPVANAFYKQGYCSTLKDFIQCYLLKWQGLTGWPGVEKPLYIDYLQDDLQAWLTHTPIPLGDLLADPFYLLLTDSMQKPFQLVSQEQVVIVMEQETPPHWLIAHAELNPQQNLVVVSSHELDTGTWMLLAHHASHLALHGYTGVGGLDSLIYRISRGQACSTSNPLT